jgi:hypothetical protein
LAGTGSIAPGSAVVVLLAPEAESGLAVARRGWKVDSGLDRACDAHDRAGSLDNIVLEGCIVK